ncbi:MAG: glycosyltransferase [Clostridia bacterium]|nr:glycosyltransferase [Clostridia bacterium]
MEPRIRTALLNDSFPPQIDGVANAVINYASLLHGRGDDVMVITPAYPGVEDHYDYEVLRYSSVDTTKIIGYRAGYPFSASAVQRVVDFAPDILHTHCPVSSLLMARVVR